jgi:uncharacterized protein (DUF433 family)
MKQTISDELYQDDTTFIAGTRITWEMLWEVTLARNTVRQIQSRYPGIPVNDWNRAMAYFIMVLEPCINKSTIEQPID